MRKIKTNSLAFRLVFGAVVWVVATLVAGGLTLSALFRDAVERAFDARLVVQLDALIAASGVDAGGNFVVRRVLTDPRFDRPYSGWYWQVSSKERVLARSRSLWDQTLDPTLARFTDDQQVLDQNNQRLRLIGRLIAIPGYRNPVFFMTAGRAREIDDEVRGFNEALFYSLGALGLGLIFAVIIQVRFGLFPLRRVLKALAAVRAGKTSLLEGRFPSEIQPLAEEINGLITHNSDVLTRTRTHVGNLAHALKTPLSVLTNESQTQTGDLARTVARQVATMRRHIEHYLAKARTAAASSVLGVHTDVMPVVEDLRRTLSRIYPDRAITVENGHGALLAFRGERRDLEEMLGNIIDNAGKWSRHRIVVGVGKTGRRIIITIDDDGPGLAPALREEAFVRGHRLDEAKPGSGLGLAIVRDTAGLYGGEVTLADSPLGGLRVTLSLPAAPTGERQ